MSFASRRREERLQQATWTRNGVGLGLAPSGWPLLFLFEGSKLFVWRSTRWGKNINITVCGSSNICSPKRVTICCFLLFWCVFSWWFCLVIQRPNDSCQLPALPVAEWRPGNTWFYAVLVALESWPGSRPLIVPGWLGEFVEVLWSHIKSRNKTTSPHKCCKLCKVNVSDH